MRIRRGPATVTEEPPRETPLGQMADLGRRGTGADPGARRPATRATGTSSHGGCGDSIPAAAAAPAPAPDPRVQVISFVGAGPGAPDLLTLRAARRLADADVVVWASSLVPADVLAHCREDVELHDSAGMTLEDVLAVYAAHPGARITRLHSGDVSVYSSITEQIAWCVQQEREFEIVPGVGSLAAAAATAGVELTVPGVAQSAVLTRLGGGRTAASMPAGESVAEFAKHGTTMAVYLSAARPGSCARSCSPATRVTPRRSWSPRRAGRTRP